MLKAGINKVELDKSKNNIFDNYRFKFTTSNGLIYLYSTEFLRYGILSNKKQDFLLNSNNISLLCVSIKDTIVSLSKEKGYLK